MAAPLDGMAILAAVAAAAFFSMEQIWGKRGIEAGGSPLLASLMVAAIAMLVFGTVGALRSDLATVIARSPEGIVVFLAAGAVASGLGVLLAYAGTARVGASIGTAVVNSRPLFVALLGYLFLGESLAPVTVAGIAVLVVGLVLIALSRGGDIRGWRPIELAFPVGAAGAFALGNVARRYGLTRTDVPLFEGIAVNALGGLLVLLVYVGLTRGRAVLRAPRAAYAWFLVMGSTTALALLALFFALARERAAIVDSISSTAPLLTLVLTLIVLRDVERVTGRVVAGAALVVAGAVIIVGV